MKTTIFLLTIGIICTGCAEESATPTELKPEPLVEEPELVSNVATLIKTLPLDGEIANESYPLVLYFDKEPLCVHVNGAAATIKGEMACWHFLWRQGTGSQEFQIDWINPDGTKHDGTKITLKVTTFNGDLVHMASAQVSDGANDVDPNEVNEIGIRYDFTEPIIEDIAQVLDEAGANLHWKAVWKEQTLELHRGDKGELLEHETTYQIFIMVAEAWTPGPEYCKCMTCLRNRNSWMITFVTKPEEDD